MTDRRSPTSWVLVAGLAAGALVLAGCAKDAPQDSLSPAGPEARTIDDLFRPVAYVAILVGLIVAVALVICLVRFRQRDADDATPPIQTHGKPALEISLTIAPALLLATIGVFTVSAIFDLSQEPDDALQVNVTGQQWWWEMAYPTLRNDEGQAIVTSGELVIPADEPVVLHLSSRDVIHSFWIPRLNGKRDAVPNRVQTLTVQADEPGEYWGQCAEFCGLSHAKMRMKVVALDEADWDRWVENQMLPGAAPEGDLASEGQAQFVAQCVRCHQVNGLEGPDGTPLVPDASKQVVSGAAPNLTHLMSRTTFAGATYPLKREACTNDAAYTAAYPTGTADNCLDKPRLEQWLRNPESLKPMFVDPSNLSSTNGLYRGMPNLGLSEAQIDALVAYLQTLK